MASEHAGRLFTYGELRSVLAAALLARDAREDAPDTMIDDELEARIAELPGRAVPDLAVPMTRALLEALVAYSIAHGAGRLERSEQDPRLVLERWLVHQRELHEYPLETGS